VGRRFGRCSDSNAEMLRYRFNWAIWPAAIEKALLPAGPDRARLQIGPIGEGEPLDRSRRRFSVSGDIATRCPGRRRAPSGSAPKGSASRVFFMFAARWFSTVRWLMPRSAAMFLLGGRRASAP
jgi:hypothetical protein